MMILELVRYVFSFPDEYVISLLRVLALSRLGRRLRPYVNVLSR